MRSSFVEVLFHPCGILMFGFAFLALCHGDRYPKVCVLGGRGGVVCDAGLGTGFCKHFLCFTSSAFANTIPI